MTKGRDCESDRSGDSGGILGSNGGSYLGGRSWGKEMSEIKDGGPAFPVPESVLDCRAFQPDYQGMTLRDYFAAQALTGLISGTLADGTTMGPTSETLFAQVSYQIADEMIRAREK